MLTALFCEYCKKEMEGEPLILLLGGALLAMIDSVLILLLVMWIM